jgi:hypothetical protein
LKLLPRCKTFEYLFLLRFALIVYL